MAKTLAREVWIVAAKRTAFGTFGGTLKDLTATDLGLQDPGENPDHLNLRVARQRAEAQAARQALAVAKGNLSRAAELLGVTRPTLYDLLEKHRIDAAQFGRNAGAAAGTAPEPQAPAGPPEPGEP